MIIKKLLSGVNNYYQLIKPGIVRGNAITAVGGFLFASKGEINLQLLTAMLVGISLVVASGCVFNNYIDRKIDKKMKRTKNRALVTGRVKNQNAIIFASILGISGVWLLNTFTNSLTTAIALFGFVAYVVVYGVAKRYSVHGTVVGSISGAVPPVVGYISVTNQLDIAALLLFLILVFWQMPHFYAIAIFRIKDYASASIPVLPIKEGIYNTKVQIILYIFAFSAATFALTALVYASYSYLFIMAGLCAYWIHVAMKGFDTKDDNTWARRVFGASLLVLMTFSVLISIDNWLP